MKSNLTFPQPNTDDTAEMATSSCTIELSLKKIKDTRELK